MELISDRQQIWQPTAIIRWRGRPSLLLSEFPCRGEQSDKNRPPVAPLYPPSCRAPVHHLLPMPPQHLPSSTIAHFPLPLTQRADDYSTRLPPPYRDSISAAKHRCGGREWVWYNSSMGVEPWEGEGDGLEPVELRGVEKALASSADGSKWRGILDAFLVRWWRGSALLRRDHLPATMEAIAESLD